MNRPAAVLRRLLGRMPGRPARDDPATLARDREILTAAFRAGTWLEAPKPVASAQADEELTARPAPGSGAMVRPTRTSRPIESEPALTREASSTIPRPTHAAARSEALPPRQAGDTAPDSLLRAPKNVASVADDFFDGLVRRVEDDR